MRPTLVHTLVTLSRPVLAAVLFASVSPNASAQNDPDRLLLQVEALKRLKDTDLDSRPALRQALERVLAATKGTPAFVELARDFKRSDLNPDLLAFALAFPNDAMAPEALKRILESGASQLLQEPLKKPAQAALLIHPLSRTGRPESIPLLTPLLTQPSNPIDLRRDIVRALSRSQPGALALLQLASKDELPSDVRWIAASELNSARWRDVREKAAQLLPLPATKDNAPLPPVADLARARGDAARGALVFRKPEVNCIGCHQVRNEGQEFGPNLSEIGTKLAREALFESILDPNAGISFGFESWQFILKNDDEVFGLLASETEDEVVVRQQGGASTRLKKSEIAKREKQATSAMPTGLQSALTREEFVDLVEYLASLRKPSAP